MATLVLLLMIAFCATGMPVAFAMGVASLVYMLVQGNLPLISIPQRMLNGADNFPLLAIPFFMLAGSLGAAAPLAQGRLLGRGSGFAFGCAVATRRQTSP